MNQTPTATVDVTSITRIDHDHDEALQITAVENRKFGELMKALSPTRWRTSTECTLCDVRSMAADLILVLDGPAGGTFVQGIGGEEVHTSVVDFVRTLTERTTASGILHHDPSPLKSRSEPKETHHGEHTHRRDR